jgi:hypothetical protein
VSDTALIRQRFDSVAPFLDERGRRLVAASEAVAAGRGGIAAVAAATGIAPSTIGRGIEELWRRPGGGRKPTIEKNPTLLSDLEALVEPTSRGDPEQPLHWTCKRLRQLAGELKGLRRRAIRSALRLSANCWKALITACKATAKPRKAQAIPTATRNFTASMTKWPRLWRRSNR